MNLLGLKWDGNGGNEEGQWWPFPSLPFYSLVLETQGEPWGSEGQP